jgi:carbon-monoxide dehydrogenase small subunit
MTLINLTVNGRQASGNVEPRTHLADFLREQMNLTGTHLRCEQGVCGICTILIDGQPARSCITYAVLCEGAEITTIEGLENDPISIGLRRAFSAEHGLQCGFCTPAMLITARDIIQRLPDADEARIRLELSGNLCRCTGYVGIVRAVTRAMKEFHGDEVATPIAAPLGPVGARATRSVIESTPNQPHPRSRPLADANPDVSSNKEITGLGERQPNIRLQRSFTVPNSPRAVWDILVDVRRVVRCVPGASLTRLTADGQATGQLAVKLGPISARFFGEAQFTRDDSKQRGMILGSGRDQLMGSHGIGEIEYIVTMADDQAGARVDVEFRALLAGLFAQFSRSGIIDDVVDKIIEKFVANLKVSLSGVSSDDLQESATTALRAGSLFRQILAGRFKNWFARLYGKSSS